MSKEEMIKQLVSHDGISAKLSELTKRFDEFSDKHETLHSELKITQMCNYVFLERVYQLERNGVSNSRITKGETLEINLVTFKIMFWRRQCVMFCP